MSGSERRKKIMHMLSTSTEPVAGTKLAQELDVSRQVVVQDIALLRANGAAIYSTTKGYLLQAGEEGFSRVFKVMHTPEQVEEELSLFIDMGGKVKDVFVYHKVYNVIRAELNIKCRRDIRKYMEEIKCGRSNLLSSVTSGYHYHTIVAEDEETLDAIQDELAQRGFLAKLQDYEPVDFWSGKEA